MAFFQLPLSIDTVSEFQLSYLLVAHNNLSALRPALARLTAVRQPDEEIIVIDGGSTDGTPDYLHQQQAAGLIQQYRSEPQKGDAHGLNKGLVMARGQFVKIVTLTDAFCLPAIREAAAFMQAHPEIDALIGNTGALAVAGNPQITLRADQETAFKRWFEHKEAAPLLGLSLVLRHQALALTGFLHPGLHQVDQEFLYRITSLNVTLAWTSAVLATYVRPPAGANAAQGVAEEAERVAFFHDKRQGQQPFRRLLRNSGLLPQPVQSAGKGGTTLAVPGAQGTQPEAAVAACETAMAEYNAAHPAKVLFKAQQITKAFQKPA